MSFVQGIDFRATSGFVNDAGNDPELGTTANYPRVPTIGDAAHVGWEQAPGGTRDRTTTQDVRLAGIAFTTPVINYRVDLPSPGDYTIRLACGDYNTAASIRVELFDDATSLGVLLNNVAIAKAIPGNYADAAGAVYSATDWPTRNTPVTKTFSSTILRLAIGGSGGTSSIAHLRVEAANLSGVWGWVG